MKNFISIFTAISFLILGACANENNEPAKTDFTERNKASIIKANDELFNKGNLDFADEVFTDNYAEQGPTWIKEYVGNMRTAFPDIQVSIEPIIAEEIWLLGKERTQATHQGEFMGFQPSEQKITWKIMVFSEYNEDGKVVKEWGVSDLYEVLQKNKTEEIAEE